MARPSLRYEPRSPAQRVLYQVVCDHLETFRLRATHVCDGAGLPRFVQEEVERTCRYALRPPVADERIRLTESGRVLLELRHRWRDGTTHLRFDPIELLERLAALTPRPRINLVLYIRRAGGPRGVAVAAWDRWCWSVAETNRSLLERYEAMRLAWHSGHSDGRYGLAVLLQRGMWDWMQHQRHLDGWRASGGPDALPPGPSASAAASGPPVLDPVRTEIIHVLGAMTIGAALPPRPFISRG